MNTYIKYWVEHNIYPKVSPKVKWSFWAIFFLLMFGLAGNYDLWFASNF